GPELADPGPRASVCTVGENPVARALAALRRGGLCRTASNSGHSVGGAIAVAADLRGGGACMVRRRARTWSAADSKALTQIETLLSGGDCAPLPADVSPAALGELPRIPLRAERFLGGSLTEASGIDAAGHLLAWQFRQPLPRAAANAELARQAAELVRNTGTAPCQPHAVDGGEGEVQVRVTLGQLSLGPWNAATWRATPCLQPVWRWVEGLRAAAAANSTAR
ncbi:MAG: hypothetical protein HY902_04255, partial [Deltaproteobacteria bacterium]|nr:hypothetical protein [Deltaproteobacteria bacterium]